MNQCIYCHGNGKRYVLCPVCNGSKSDPRGNSDVQFKGKPCSYCGGTGHKLIACEFCGGSGLKL